jgi:hypothetical protein
MGSEEEGDYNPHEETEEALRLLSGTELALDSVRRKTTMAHPCRTWRGRVIVNCSEVSLVLRVGLIMREVYPQ